LYEFDFFLIPRQIEKKEHGEEVVGCDREWHEDGWCKCWRHRRFEWKSRIRCGRPRIVGREPGRKEEGCGVHDTENIFVITARFRIKVRNRIDIRLLHDVVIISYTRAFYYRLFTVRGRKVDLCERRSKWRWNVPVWTCCRTSDERPTSNVWLSRRSHLVGRSRRVRVQ